MAAWSSGMILASGARGPGHNSRSSPMLGAISVGKLNFPLLLNVYCSSISSNPIVSAESAPCLRTPISGPMSGLWMATYSRQRGDAHHFLPSRIRVASMGVACCFYVSCAMGEPFLRSSIVGGMIGITGSDPCRIFFYWGLMLVCKF